MRILIFCEDGSQLKITRKLGMRLSSPIQDGSVGIHTIIFEQSRGKTCCKRWLEYIMYAEETSRYQWVRKTPKQKTALPEQNRQDKQ